MKKSPNKSLLVILIIVFAIAAVAGYVVWKRNNPGFSMEGTITETPVCGPELCSASYVVSTQSGEKYFINTAVPKSIDGNSDIKCLDFEKPKLGDKIRFNLRFVEPPANALVSHLSYSTCYPANQKQGYFLRIL